MFDCDTSQQEREYNNTYVRVIPRYENKKCMKIGIENALALDKVDTTSFYETKVKEGNYGDDNTIVEFKKMEFCEYLCSLDDELLSEVFSNLKSIIDSLAEIFSEYKDDN